MEIERAVVIGAGVMGSGIAQVLAVGGCQVTCCDVDQQQLDRAAQQTNEGRYGLARAVERGKLTADDARLAAERLTFSDDAAGAIASADLVLEAVPERLELKVELFGQWDALAPAHAILASNTSGLSIATMAAATARPDKVIGWHWSSPAQVMAMAEVVVAPSTSDDTRDAVVDLARRCGKNPVVVQDNAQTWGHVGNRIYFAAIREAQKVVDEGLTDQAGVDQILMDGWGWPAGPFGMTRGARAGWTGSEAKPQ
jgi:3-hydroxyacyl-CoA dehydrogenase